MVCKCGQWNQTWKEASVFLNDLLYFHIQYISSHHVKIKPPGRHLSAIQKATCSKIIMDGHNDVFVPRWKLQKLSYYKVLTL